jgi:hypothetical protein
MADKRAIMLSKNAKQLFLSLGTVCTNYFCVPELFVPRVLDYCTTDGHSRLQRVVRVSPPPLSLPLRRCLSDPRVTVKVVPENQADRTLLFFF